MRCSAASTDTQTTSHAAPLYDLTAFQRDVLRVLAEDSRPGLRIKETLEEAYGTEVTHGRLYANLDTLVDKGFVQKTELDGRTNEYTITTRGRREFVGHCNWMTQPLELELELEPDSDSDSVESESESESESASETGGDGE